MNKAVAPGILSPSNGKMKKSAMASKMPFAIKTNTMQQQGSPSSGYSVDTSIAKSKKRMAAEMVILTTKLHHIEKDQAARETIQEELSSLEASYAKEMEKLKRKKRKVNEKHDALTKRNEELKAKVATMESELERFSTLYWRGVVTKET